MSYPPEFGIRRLIDDAFHAAGVSPQTFYEVPAGFADIADLVANGLGTTFMPESEARRFPALRRVKLTDPASRGAAGRCTRPVTTVMAGMYSLCCALTVCVPTNGSTSAGEGLPT